MTSPDGPRSTCSPGSEDGHTPSISPDGPQTSPCGPSHVPVSRFRALDADRELPTNATSGLLFSSSSPSYDLQCCLESRLRAALDVNGSPEYALTWKSWDMPAGLPICALRALPRRTSASASTSLPAGWPTPTANDDNKTPAAHLAMKERMGGGRKAITSLQVMAKMVAGWPTPKAERGDQDTTYARGNPTLARVAGWSTPTANDVTQKRYTRDQGDPDRPRPTNFGLLAGWPTPNAIPESRGGLQRNPEAALKRREQGHMLNLDDAATLAGWQSPTTGATLSGSNAPIQTGRESGALSPEFSRWLQGFPRIWDATAPAKRRGGRQEHRRGGPG